MIARTFLSCAANAGVFMTDNLLVVGEGAVMTNVHMRRAICRQPTTWLVNVSVHDSTDQLRSMSPESVFLLEFQSLVALLGRWLAVNECYKTHILNYCPANCPTCSYKKLAPSRRVSGGTIITSSIPVHRNNANEKISNADLHELENGLELCQPWRRAPFNVCGLYSRQPTLSKFVAWRVDP